MSIVTTQTAGSVSNPKRGFWMGWSLALLFGGTLLVALMLPPFVGEKARHVVMAVFSGVCHQLPDRSPQLGGVQLAVCHRCLGIYLALFAAPFGFLVLRKWDGLLHRGARWFVLGAVLIPGTDWLGDAVGLWANTPLTRLATGAVFGLTAGYFLCRALIELCRGRVRTDSIW